MQRAFLTILLIILIRVNGFAQILDNVPKVDTLSAGQCVSFRTNMFDWAMLTPNIGMEINVGNKNWSRWALEFNAKYLGTGKHTYTPIVVYGWQDYRFEVRNYWRTRNMSDPINRMLPRHQGLWQHLLSHRRRRAKHPHTVYYRGVYAGYTKFNVRGGMQGYKGNALHAGLTVGMMRPMYTYTNGHSLDLELGVSLGAVALKYDKYHHDEENDVYSVVKAADKWKIVPFPVVSEIRAGVVYRMNKYPLDKRYKWRYEVDIPYQMLMDSLNQAKAKAIFEKHYYDSIYKHIYKDYKHIYDSLARKNQIRQDSINNVKKAEAAKAAAEERAKKFKEKQALEKQKAEEKAAARKLELEKKGIFVDDKKDAAKKAGKDSLKVVGKDGKTVVTDAASAEKAAMEAEKKKMASDSKAELTEAQKKAAEKEAKKKAKEEKKKQKEAEKAKKAAEKAAAAKLGSDKKEDSKKADDKKDDSKKSDEKSEAKSSATDKSSTTAANDEKKEASK